jgi:hypothetical protein
MELAFTGMADSVIPHEDTKQILNGKLQMLAYT